MEIHPPPKMVGIHSINLLEFIAATITIHLTITTATTPQKILAFTGSSRALGWLYSASFWLSHPAHDKVARWLAKELIRYDSALYSQHIRGKYNFISDSLSRDTHISKQQLTHVLRSLLPEQTPTSFEILDLLPDLTYWLQSLNRLSTKDVELQKQPSRSKLGALIDGSDFWTTWESKMSSLKDIIEDRKCNSCPRS